MHSPASIPCSSHVLELTMPMEAVAAAPICPTMAASMYSIAVTTSCCKMEGMLSVSAMLGGVGTAAPVLALPHPGRELLKCNGHGTSCVACENTD